MPTKLEVRASDRVLVIAPHPDDESLACGGLLLAAGTAGAARHVVVLTDGDNNPWPQRWIEKRWRIDAAARARWGARRRAEAQAALDVLGVAREARSFLGWPDAGLTDLLMREPATVAHALTAQIDAFRPTHIAIPALDDAHPDHAAAHVAVRFTLMHAQAPAAQCLIYAVHGAKGDARAQVVARDARQRELKQRAILQHQTQMRLSRKRFLGFASRDERYRVLGQEQVRGDHPLMISIDAAHVELRVDMHRVRRVGSLHLLLAIDAADGTPLRWRVPISADAEVQVFDLAADRNALSTRWQRDGGALHTTLALPLSREPQIAFCKLAQNRAGLVVYDRYGWQAVSRNPA